jgi:hypothetical protein
MNVARRMVANPPKHDVSATPDASHKIILLDELSRLAGDFRQLNSQSSHRKRVKTIENQGFLTTPSSMGRSVAVKAPTSFQIANKINGFEHISYGTALN